MLKPFTAFAWDETEMSNISSIIWANLSDSPQEIAHKINQKEKGKRVLLLWGTETLFWDQHQDYTEDGKSLGPWLKQGTRNLFGWAENFFSKFKKAGGDIDYLAVDLEVGFNSWHMSQEQMNSIAADRRYFREANSIAKAMNYTDVSKAATFWHTPQITWEWNAVMKQKVNEALNNALFKPLKHYFPDAMASEMASSLISKDEVKWSADINGYPQYSYGPIFGTHQSPTYYGATGWIRVRIPENDWDSPFPILVYQTNIARAIARSSSTPVCPWISFSGYIGDTPPASKNCYAYANTPYYSEQLIHLVMAGANTNFLFWNPHAWDEKHKPDHFSTKENEEELNLVMKMLQGRFPEGISLADIRPLSHDSAVVVSSCRSGNKVITRIAFSPECDSIKLESGIVVERPSGQTGVWLETSL